ncbi:MAG: ATP-binding protein, partial [Dehalococcoidia bacterium]
MSVEPWEQFGSAVLEAEALERRLSSGPPRDLAGLVIEDEEVDRLLAALPGLAAEATPPPPHDVTARLAELRARFHASLDDGSRFSTLARRAALGRPEAEVLAALAAIERSPARQRLLAYAQDDVSATRPWTATVGRLFAGEHPGLLTLADGARLRRAEFVEVHGDSPWATRPVQVAPRVLWALAGDASPDPALPRRAEVMDAADRPGARP